MYNNNNNNNNIKTLYGPIAEEYMIHVNKFKNNKLSKYHI